MNKRTHEAENILSYTISHLLLVKPSAVYDTVSLLDITHPHKTYIHQNYSRVHRLPVKAAPLLVLLALIPVMSLIILTQSWK
jgi:ABC-type arginine/histidine transport system permease subunit